MGNWIGLHDYFSSPGTFVYDVDRPTYYQERLACEYNEFLYQAGQSGIGIEQSSSSDWVAVNGSLNTYLSDVYDYVAAFEVAHAAGLPAPIPPDLPTVPPDIRWYLVMWAIKAIAGLLVRTIRGSPPLGNDTLAVLGEIRDILQTGLITDGSEGDVSVLWTLGREHVEVVLDKNFDIADVEIGR